MGMTIKKMYGSYSDADLNDWERFPMNSRVLTSSAFGAWLMRRDENRDRSLYLTSNSVLEDCISRSDIIDRCKYVIDHGKPSNGKHSVSVETLLDVVQSMPSVTPQEPRIDFDELKRKIFMEVDGGTGDNWLRYGDVCDRISDSIDEFAQKVR